VRRGLIVASAVAALAVLFPAHALAAQFVFGSTDTSISTVTDSLTIGLKGVNTTMVSPKAGTLVKVEGYLDGKGKTTGTETARIVVYNLDASGNPTGFLGVSSEVSVAANAAKGWTTFTFPTTVSIPAGKVGFGYWAGTGTTDLIRPYYDTLSQSCSLRYNSNAYSSTGNPSNPFNASGAVSCGSKSKPWGIRVTANDVPTLSERVGINTPNVATDGWNLLWGQTILADDGIHLFRDSVGPLNIWATETSNPDWTFVNRNISFVTSVTGGELLPIFHGSNPWQHPSCTPGTGQHGYNCPPDPQYYTEWANEVVTVIGHLITNGVAVPEIEIWNEPWCCSFWVPQSNVAAYRNLVEAVLPIVWQTYPTMKVLVAAAYWEEGSTCEANPCPQWAGPLFQGDTTHGLNDPRVILYQHNYMQNLSPQTDRALGWDWTRYLDVRSIAQSFGKTSPHFEIDEMGWEANDGYCAFGCVTLTQQSQYTTDAMKIAFEDACACVDRIFPFTEYRGSNTGNTGLGWGYNYHRADGTARPVAGAVKSYINANIP
jgi:hypothetical protein